MATRTPVYPYGVYRGVVKSSTIPVCFTRNSYLPLYNRFILILDIWIRTYTHVYTYTREVYNYCTTLEAPLLVVLGCSGCFCEK